VLLGVFKQNIVVAFLAGTSMVLGAIYSLWLYNRLMFGQIRQYSLLLFCDVSRREFNILIPLAFFTILLGVYPSVIMNALSMSVNNYIF
jgi:NADH:ubiquinone oxidoreductase subunit 4 (subunit M)